MARSKSAPKKPKRKAALKPRTQQAEPDAQAPLIAPYRSAGVRVNEETALTLGAVYACVKVISEDLAGLPWHVHEKLANGGSIEVPEDPADWLLHTQGSPETPAFQWRETIIAHALTWGNGYAEIERDLAGRPMWLWLITPDRVEPFRDGAEIAYEVRNPTGPPTYLPAEDMYHLRGLGFDGLVGYPVVRFAARSIGAGIALDQSTSDLFANDSTPGGTLNHPGRLSKEARERLKRDWEARHQGPSNRRRVAILEEGLKWEQTGLPPEDSKLIEQRQFTPADICRWFRVKPHKIADLSRSTFSNIEAENTSHVTDTLLPWARRLETEANIKLFGRTNRGRRFTKLNFKGFLRGDTMTRSAFYTAMVDRGIFSINDVLTLEDRNPIGPDGDKRFVPLNMQLLENAGTLDPWSSAQNAGDDEPPPDDEQTDEDADDGDEDSNDSKDDEEKMSAGNAIARALLPVFEDACRRLLYTESERFRRSIKGGTAKAMAWFDQMRDDHAGHVCMALRPAVSSLMLAMGVPDEQVDDQLGRVAESHMLALAERWTRAANAPSSPVAWDTLAVETAANIVKRLSTAVEVRHANANPSG